MGFDPNKHQRRSIRLQDYDYDDVGAYFITICTFQRRCLFGKIIEREMELSTFGKIALDEWQKTEVVRQNITIDEFIIMPNHIHGIIIIQNRPPPTTTNDPVGASGSLAQPTRTRANAKLTAPPSGSLGAIIAQYKSIVTKRIQKLYGEKMQIWQRNYYERIIRDEEGLNRARQYIINNPMKWADDTNFAPHP